MNVYELVEALDGEIVNNKAKVRLNGVMTVIGRVMDGELTLTEEGVLLAEETVIKPGKTKAKAKVKAEADAETTAEGDA